MDYCYEAEFMLEGVRVDKPLKEGGFLIAPVPSHERRANLRYSFCMDHLSEKEAEDKVNRDVSNFLSFALLGIYLRGGSSAFTTKFLKIRCTNYEDLIKSKQKPPSFGNIKFSTVYRFKNRTLKGVMKEYKKYSHVIQPNIWVALNFWRTGLSSGDVYLRFEQVWKAFEIFFRTITRKTRIEMVSIRFWLTKVLSPSNMKYLCDQYSKTGNTEIDFNVGIQGCQSAFDCLVKQNFTSSSGTTNYSEDLKDAIAKANYHEILANTLMCLSKLRNNVFHANIFRDKERPLIFVGCSILADVLTSGFLFYINQLI